MKVENYSEPHLNSVIDLVRCFYKEYLTGHLTATTDQAILETVNSFRGDNSKNLFLLIDGQSCVGLLAGIEINAKLNDQRFYQEIIWYAKSQYGRHGLLLIKHAQIILKSRGFTGMIMAVVESRKAHRLKRIYERMGYQHLETHYIRQL